MALPEDGMFHRIVLPLVFAAIAADCSAPSNPSSSGAPRSLPTAASAAPPPLPSLASSNGPLYLSDLQRRPDFSLAFAAMAGASQLPGWTAQGGTATPVQRVNVEGEDVWLASACKPHDCPDERILVLYDEHSHAMTGVFARRKPNAPDVDSNDAANDELTWLGAPDDATKQFLQRRLYRNN